MAVAGSVACGLDTQGAVWCASAGAPDVALVAGLPVIRQLVGGMRPGEGRDKRFCGISVADSTAWCWIYGSAPEQIAGSPAFTALWMSWSDGVGIPVLYPDYRACGLLADSTAACWGIGPPGDGTITGYNGVGYVAGEHRFVELTVADGFSCGRKANGEVWCWGDQDVRLPTMVLGPGGGSRLAGYSVKALVLGFAGANSLWLWANAEVRPGPTGLPELPIAGFAYNSLTCVRLADDEVYCSSDLSNTSIVYLNVTHYEPVQPVRSETLTARTTMVSTRGFP